MTNRYADLFKTCHHEKSVALIPFFVLAYPDVETSLRLILKSIAAGADALELGLPFSDPIADGPIIQEATFDALKAGMNFDQALTLIHQVRKRHEAIPIGILAYANAVETHQDTFYQGLRTAGADSVLLADIPTDYLTPYADKAKRSGLDPICLATPSCDDESLKQIPVLSSGYTYIVTRKGVTGDGIGGKFEAAKALQDKLMQLDAPPAVYGFGIQTPEDIQAAKKAGAKGVIVGSKLVQLYQQTRSEKAVIDYIKILNSAC